MGLKVFLDTCVINRIVDFGEYIFDGYLQGTAFDEYVRRPPDDKTDIMMLRNILLVFQKSSTPIIFSRSVMTEILRSHNMRHHQYTSELFAHWIECGVDSMWETTCSASFKREVAIIAERLECLKDESDRALVSEATLLGCDYFLTVDRKTIWNRRENIPEWMARVIRPHELWDKMKPWVALV